MNMTEYTEKMTQLFLNKNWCNPASKNSLKEIILLGENIDSDSRAMLYELTVKFEKITWNDYLNRLFDSLNLINFDDAFFSNINNIYLLPILKDSDKDKAKSPQSTTYAFSDEDLECHPFFQKFNILRESERNTIKSIKNDNNYRIMLIDDFIGTGGTAIKYLDEISSKYQTIKDNIFFIFIAGMEEGINFLTSKGYKVYCGYIQAKGISDIQEAEKKDKYIELMNKLEKKFSIIDKFHFGYGHSEALIKMIRTPNNTFPIYWDKKKNKHAPFKR